MLIQLPATGVDPEGAGEGGWGGTFVCVIYFVLQFHTIEIVSDKLLTKLYHLIPPLKTKVCDEKGYSK